MRTLFNRLFSPVARLRRKLFPPKQIVEGILLIDDLRNLPAERVARTFNQGIEALGERRWDVLLLDHDLADFTGPDGRELTGYDVMCWLEAYPEHLPGRIEIVSANPVGRQRMEMVIRKLYSGARAY